jgi:hypothetical protein
VQGEAEENKMKKQALRCIALVLLLIGFQAVTAAQEAISKAQEQVARSQETAAKHQATAARLAAESASDPASANLIRDAAARARDAANRAQDAANRAQDAANQDPTSSEAQAAALRAQEAANRALESANLTQESANRMRRTGAAAGEGVVVSARDSASSNPPATPANTASNTPSDTALTNTGGISSSGSAPSSGTTTGTNGDAAVAGTGTATPAATTAPTAPTRPAAGATQPSASAKKRAISTEARDFVEYINTRAEEISIASLGPKNNTNQSEAPSISTNSTSLVEKSSVGDLFNFAFNPAGTAGGSSSDSTSTAISLTAYALKAFLSGEDPLDPAFYTSNRKWRKVSFTYGHDFPEGEEGNVMERGDIFGLKFLPYDKRDVSHPSNRTDIETVTQALGRRGRAIGSLVTDVQLYIYNTLNARNALPASVLSITDTDSALEFRRRNNALAKFIGSMGYTELVALLGEEGIKEIDNLIAQRTEFTEFDSTVENIINKIRRRPQVSMFFLTNQRKQLRPDEYNAGLSLDLGLAERWNLTFNGTFNYTDNKLKGDNRGGKFGTELLIPITAMNRLADRAPATFSFAASGEWKTKFAPMYQGQAKLTIPLPFLQGLEMPISVSFASRSELINESDVRGRIGFTFDMARLLSGLKSKFLPNIPIPVP